eukprot:TRINITY_DN17769_c0_g1_i2.p1 TRINITY_DN17769_c0_g1~~TRINITY_DN17769_c0_g1_i2.p1  ORF type:complete len:483 (+),score=43.27 TRINITY_DN17769_c0_g1_i2:113-1450(+)
MPGFGSVATPDFSGGDRTAPRRASSLRRFSQELTPRGERTPRSSSVRRSPDQRSHSAPRGGKGIVGERRGSRDLSPAPARKVTPREFFIAQEARCSMHPLPVKSGKLVVRTPLENPLVAGDSSSDQPRAAGFSVAQERALQEQRELPDAAAIAAAEAAATRFRGFSAKSLRRHDGQAVKNIFAAWEQENEPPQQAQECGQHMDVTLKGAAGRTVQVSIPGRPRPQYVLQTLADGIMPAYEPDVARDCYRVPGHLRHCVVDADGEWNDLTPRERSSSVQAQNRNRRSEDVRAALSGHAEAVAESQSLDAARREADASRRGGGTERSRGGRSVSAEGARCEPRPSLLHRQRSAMVRIDEEAWPVRARCGRITGFHSGTRGSQGQAVLAPALPHESREQRLPHGPPGHVPDRRAHAASPADAFALAAACARSGPCLVSHHWRRGASTS